MSDGQFTDSATFEIKPCKFGLGLVAIDDIEQGATIHSEAPLLTCPTTTTDVQYMEKVLTEQVQQLTEDERGFFGNLTDAPKEEKLPLAGRIRTNALPCGRNGSSCAVFRTISLANHDCIPNAEYYWDAEGDEGVLYCLKPIKGGEDITISYIDMMPHKQRQMALKGFGFVCACNLCKLSKSKRRVEDRRIREIASLQAALFTDPLELCGDTDVAMAKFQRLALLYDESFAGYERDLVRLWAGVADLCVANHEKEEAMEKLMAVTDMPLDEAAEIVEAWYAQYEDEGL